MTTFEGGGDAGLGGGFILFCNGFSNGCEGEGEVSCEVSVAGRRRG